MAVALPSVPISDATEKSGFVTRTWDDDDAAGDSQPKRDGVNAVYQIWDVTFGDITTAEAETLRTFLTTHAETSSITWTPPGQSTPLLFRTEGDPSFSHSAFESWTVRITLEQIFDYE